MSDPRTHQALAPRDPADRARYLAELKLEYQRGSLRARVGPPQPSDQVVALLFPHIFPREPAEA
jgi:hypothetical protein